ncbi:dipeptidase PepE [Thalassotalea sp. LPB0316]|uniref:dipeptidase PepE n=1 Tax=Thalassotalea sp. LPB0316 TaxID=2769490 RepID=UPI001866023A|nr:dipeptidase PepE [Thalassotalea sp. LPB0316]QOL24849.1 dipeptidase PepE [Thalassotalea sp. LPB0316]
MNLLLLSSSRVEDTPYLAHAKGMISDHLGSIKEVVFIPYAGVTITYDEYTDMVQTALKDQGIKVKGIHQFNDPVTAIEQAAAIAVGGGNTFRLLHQLYENKLVDAIQTKVSSGTPYIGWSAGSNVAGATIRTTNDMPIIEPPSFNALNLVNFQINPHYTDYTPPGHNGETREQRLQEFMVLNPTTHIVGIVEGSAIKMQGDHLKLIGGKEGFLFLNGEKTKIADGYDLTAIN